ncbi:hypothetical protein NX059_011848 [Plenodomus lindquistii]|nr:hypothetical protein NX059_011848 [Plenodomus lindquistii]
MAPKIFLTGGTGYIGGSILHTLTTTHPTSSITALLRNTPPTFTSTYPNITIIQGDYESTDLLTSTAAASDIVIHNGDSDHLPSLRALITGLLSREKPGYLLHLSGTGIVSDYATSSTLGTLSPKIWSDTRAADIEEIRNLPDTALHRHTEALLHDTIRNHADKINIAIVCPPDIYGPGLGPGKKHSALIPIFVSEAVKFGSVFYHSDGTNARSWVHIHDLMRLYASLVGAAIATSSSSSSPSESAKYFNENGYYFASTQEHDQISLSRALGKILHAEGKIVDAEPKQVSLDTLDGIADIQWFPKLARYMFASNSRTRADRAGELFGYKGEAEGLMEALEKDVLDALERL